LNKSDESMGQRIMKHEINQDTPLIELSPKLEAISKILTSMMPTFLGLIDRGVRFRHSLTLSSVIRLAIYRALHNLTFRKLADATMSNLALRSFCEIQDRRRVDKSTLQQATSSLSPSIFEQLNIVISKAYEDVSRVRFDSSSVSANVAPPENNNLLFRAVARVANIQTKIEAVCGRRIFKYYPDPKMAKQLSYQIRFSAPKSERKRDLYTQLIFQVGDLSDSIPEMLKQAEQLLSETSDKTKARRITKLINELEFLGDKISCVIYQSIAWQQNEAVLAGDKLFTIANDMEHVDVIIKDNRKTTFGHKVDIVEGNNGLIIALIVYNGNPADSSNTIPIVEMIRRIYGDSFKRFVADGGYNSRKNYDDAKRIGIEQSVFTRKRALTLAEMRVTEESFSESKNFRTGIERAFSRLKRCFGFEKVICTTFHRFHLYLIIGVVTANLALIADR
jgi:hypothetical protein